MGHTHAPPPMEHKNRIPNSPVSDFFFFYHPSKLDRSNKLSTENSRNVKRYCSSQASETVGQDFILDA